MTLTLLFATSGCSRDRSGKSASASASGQVATGGVPSISSTSSADAALTTVRAAASVPPPPWPAASALLPIHAFDAGVNACRVLSGPSRQPFLGEAAIVATDTGVLLVTHRDGVPTVTRVDGSDAGPQPPQSVLDFDAGIPHTTSPPCAVANGFSLCADRAGAIHKRPLETEGADVVVARSAPGTGFAAEAFGPDHVVVAYLAERRTTEGLVREAYAVLDDGPPLRVSDEGSGTTHVALAPRGGSILALLVDGRVAMTPVHARSLSIVGGKLRAGDDAVVFVGGGAEANTRGAVGVSATGAAFGLVPIAGETGFGLVSFKLDDPPHIDEPSTWSPYLNGLDPAPVVATRGVSPVRVARVRPLEAKADAPRGLELGKLDEAGNFISYGLVGSKGRVKSAAIAVDKVGTLWLAFTDGAGTWLERRACP